MLQAMDRNGIEQAWISNLAAMFWKDPTQGNAIVRECAERRARFRPVYAVHPGLPGWERVLVDAAKAHAPCVRADPTRYGLAPAGSEMTALAARCADSGFALLLAVRLEDGRQRHPGDHAAELDGAALRALVRSDPHVRFYAGIPLITAEGLALGALCVMDRVPRQLNPDQLSALSALSRLVLTQLEMRRNLFELRDGLGEDPRPGRG